MRKLVSEQCEATSGLVTHATVKEQQLNAVLERVVNDSVVHERRQQDVGQLQLQLEALEDQLVQADSEAAEAVDREGTYGMMERRLQKLASEDQVRINTITRVIKEAAQRLAQWHGVCREGEEELMAAESQLTAERAKQKAERGRQRKMVAERRAMTDSMMQYTNERQQRIQAHRQKMLADSGDLDAAGEERLKGVAGTIDAAREFAVSQSRAALSFEEKCREAFRQVEELTGAKGLAEVLEVVVSKKQLTEQLQQRVSSLEERVGRLNDDRDAAEQSRAEMQYGVATDAETKRQLEQVRAKFGVEGERKVEVQRRANEAVRHLQSMSLAWENILRQLEPGKAPGERAVSAAVLGSSQEPATLDTGTKGLDSGGARPDDEDDLAQLASLPMAVSEMPMLVEEVDRRTQRILDAIELRSQHGHMINASQSSLVERDACGESGAAAPAPSASSPSRPPLRQGSIKGKKGAVTVEAPRAAATDPNIRVMPPAMLDELLSRDPDAVEGGARRVTGAYGTSRHVAAKVASAEEEEELMSREDLKAVSTRLARKAQRRAEMASKRVADGGGNVGSKEKVSGRQSSKR
jgi:hypothetical protein